MFLTSYYGPTWKIAQASKKMNGTDLFFFTQPLKPLADLPFAPFGKKLVGRDFAFAMICVAAVIALAIGLFIGSGRAVRMIRRLVQKTVKQSRADEELEPIMEEKDVI